MKTLVTIPPTLVKQTLKDLQSAGRRSSERVILWLGKRAKGRISIAKLWVPEQRAGRAFFEIPEHSMRALFDELRGNRLFVAAQVHSHPEEAFHSHADDAWAIVRHVGALSFVLPHFALRTNFATFTEHAAVFVLSSTNEWTEAPPRDIENLYRISK